MSKPTSSSWSSVVRAWRRHCEELGLPPFERFAFTDVPTSLVESVSPRPRLDWWPFTPWPNPTALADRHGLGTRHGPGPDCTLSMLWEVRDNAEAAIAVLLHASLIQLGHYYPSKWRGPSCLLNSELLGIVAEADVQQPQFQWFGTTRITLPIRLFRSGARLARPESIRDLVAALALEHTLLLANWHAVRAVPLGVHGPPRPGTRGPHLSIA